MRRLVEMLVAATVALVATSGSVTFAAEGSVQPDSPEQRLAERHLPVLRVVEQAGACGPGEPYRVMRPEAVFGVDGLGRAGVVLTGGEEPVAAPTEEDLPVPGDASWHLDLPGNALRPRCDYEELFQAWRTEPTVYARLAAEDARPGEVVLQYWFFYLYNDWNDRHEGDWEMIQLHFRAADAAEAMATEPFRVAFAQHEGAEVSDWVDDVLEVRDGTRPVVYVAAGSHASYFRSARWFGKSAASGFGCDDTRGPHEDVSPAVVVLDDDELPLWAQYEGRWGERRPSFNNGPTGPITKRQWSEPVSWVDEEGRRGAVDLPVGGTAVTDAFCSVTRQASVVMFGLLDRPVLVGLLLAAVVLALALGLRATRWRPVVLEPLVVPRALGQMVSTALAVVRQHPRAVMRIGALLPLAGALGAVLQAVVLGASDLGDLADVADRGSGSGGAIALALGSVFVLPASITVSVAMMTMVESTIEQGAPPRWRDTAHVAWRHRRVIVVTWLMSVALVASLLSVVLAPVALWLGARWAVAVPAALHGSQPLRRSSQLTTGRRWRSLGVAATAVVLGSAVPSAIGIGVLLLTDASFVVVNLISTIVGTLLAPTAGMLALFQWADLEARAVSVAAPASREAVSTT